MKCSLDAQYSTQGIVPATGIFFMLIDLRRGVGAPEQQGAEQSGQIDMGPVEVFERIVIHPDIDHNKGKGPLEKTNNEPTRPWIFLQSDDGMAIGLGDETIDEQHEHEQSIDSGPQCQCDDVKSKGESVQSPVDGRRVLQPTDTALIPVEVAVVAITGRVEENM